MKSFLIVLTVLTAHTLHAQEYGWQVIATPTTQLNAVVFVDSLHGWVAGVGSAIYKTNDGGSSWIPYAGTPMQLKSISMINASTGWCAGDDGFFGRIIQTTTGGTTWVLKYEKSYRAFNSTTTQSLLRNTTVGGNQLIQPDTGLVIQTTNGGTSWQEQHFGANTRLRKVVFVDSLHGWVSSNQTFLLRTVDGGSNWTQFASPGGMSSMSFVDTVRGWALVGLGVFYGTTNGGLTWDSLSVLPDPDGAVRDIAFTDGGHGWGFGNAFYAGDSRPAIYRTTDGGYTWDREYLGVTISGLIVQGKMLDPRHGWAVGAGGRVFGYRPSTGVVEKLDRIPRRSSLRQNYPNPFNGTTLIEYEIPERSNVVLTLYDVQGRRLRTLVQASHEPGVYRLRLDIGDLASGTYMYELQTEMYQESRRLLIIK